MGLYLNSLGWFYETSPHVVVSITTFYTRDREFRAWQTAIGFFLNEQNILDKKIKKSSLFEVRFWFNRHQVNIISSISTQILISQLRWKDSKCASSITVPPTGEYCSPNLGLWFRPLRSQKELLYCVCSGGKGLKDITYTGLIFSHLHVSPMKLAPISHLPNFMTFHLTSGQFPMRSQHFLTE